MAFSGVPRVLLGLLVLLICFSMSVVAVDYRVRMLMAKTGSEAVSTEQADQWQQLAEFAAQEVSTAWNDGDNLIIDVLDTTGSALKAVELALTAASDASVIAVVTVGLENEVVHSLGRLLHFYDIALVSIDTTELDNDGLTSSNFVSMLSFQFDSAKIMKGIMTYHGWNRASVLYDSSFQRTIDLLAQTTTIASKTLTDDPMDAFKFLIDAGGSITFMVTRNISLVQLYLTMAESTFGMYDQGNAWVIVGLELDELPVPPTFPVGTLFARMEEVPSTNITAFTQIVNGLPGAPWSLVEHNAGRVYDSIHVIGNAILANKPSVSRLSVANSIVATNYYGVEGLVSFDAEHFRTGIYASILNSLPGTSNPNVTSVFAWDSYVITANGSNTVYYPSYTTVVPLADLQTYDVVWLLQVALYYGMDLNTLNQFVHYASNAVNGYSAVTYSIPRMPAGHRLRVAAVDMGLTAATAIPAAIIAPEFGVVGVVTDCDSTLTATLQNVLSPYGVVQISAAATSPALSDRTRYPTFLRNVPPDNLQGKAIINLARYYKWTELAIVYTNDAYGTGIFQVVQDSAFSEGITISAAASIDVSATDLKSQLSSFASGKPRIVLLLISIDPLKAVVEAFEYHQFKPFAIVGSDAVTYAFSDPTPYGVSYDQLQGFIATAPSGGYGSYFDAFKTEMAALTPSTPVRAYYDSAGSYAVLLLDTIFNYADAMSRMIGDGVNPKNKSALYTYMTSTDATFLTGETKYSNGDRLGEYEVYNIANGAFSVIGRLSESNVALTTSAVFTDGTTNVPLSTLPRTQKWLDWKDPAGIVFAILAILGMLTCIFMFGVMVWQRRSPVVRVATWEFLLVMLFGAALGYGSILTWIGKPQPYICGLRIWLPPMAFIFIMAPLLTKTWRLHKIFTLQDLKVQPIPLWRLVLMCAFLGIIQLIICIFWIALGTIQPVVTNDPNDKTVAYVSCGINKAGRISSYVTYGYLGFLMLIGCYLTFRARKLPKDFNETRWIGFSIYNTLLFSIIIIILGYALSKFPVTVLILICVCTFAISTGAVSFMLAPKLWTLLVHPEKRSSSSSTHSFKPNVSKRHDFSRSAGASKDSKVSKDSKASRDSKSNSKGSNEGRVPSDEL